MEKTILFHGTTETIEGRLRGGGYDGVLWTSYDSSIAQNYISTGGITTRLYKQSDYQRDSYVVPTPFMQSIGTQMGYTAIVDSKDNDWQPTSWSWNYTDEDGSVKKGVVFKMYQVEDFLLGKLGYEYNDNDYCDLKLSYIDGKEVVMPASYLPDGELYIINVKEGETLKIFDYAERVESDISDPAYNHLSVFRLLEEKGYDGIRIWDFAQSKYWGNMDHLSLGLFPNGIKKIEYLSIPAKNFEWSKENEHGKISPEYEQYLTNNNPLEKPMGNIIYE